MLNTKAHNRTNFKTRVFYIKYFYTLDRQCGECDGNVDGNENLGCVEDKYAQYKESIDEM